MSWWHELVGRSRGNIPVSVDASVSPGVNHELGPYTQHRQ